VSGALLDHFWWGSVFLINAPVMVALLLAGPLLLPEFRNPTAGRFDLVGPALSLAAVLPAVYGIKEIAVDGGGTLPVLAVVAGALLALAFVRRQQTGADPIIDVRLFRNPRSAPR
jgi:DHA2 family multidrug resistance protein-like MFS transporter